MQRHRGMSGSPTFGPGESEQKGAEEDMTPSNEQLSDLRVGDRVNFGQGPPHEMFRELRGKCPVHWSDGITEYPNEDGFWSVTTAEDVFEVSRDWQTFSSEVGGFTATKNTGLSLEMQQAMFIGMDPPKHDRLKSLFQRGFTPKRIAEHEGAIRAITVEVLDRLEGRESLRSRQRGRPAGRRARDRQLHGPRARGRRGMGAADELDRRRRRS